MAFSEEEAIKVISRIGKQLGAYKTCPNKDTLVNLLKQATRAFEGLKQSSSLKSVIRPLSSSLLKHNLLVHKDKDIRLLVGICFCEIVRVLAPNPEFSDAVSRDIFGLLVSIFSELEDTNNPFFSMRVQLLETVAKLRFCLLMLDIGCEELVKKMFKNFFAVLREHHPPSMVSAAVSIMSEILEEKMQEKEGTSFELLTFEKEVSEPLLDVILQNLLKEAKGVSHASHQLAVSVIQNCSGKIEDTVSRFLRSCILNRDAVQSEIKEYYHDIIYEIFRCSPQILLSVIPSLIHELLTDQVDVRIKALGLMKKVFSLPGNHFAQDYHQLFVEFLNRTCDKSAEVRLITLSCAKAFYMTNPSGKESLEVLSALQGRLLDSDDRVRSEAVTVVCDFARYKLKSVPLELITRVAERLRDRKVSVRKKALKKLLELYQEYCTQCAAAIMDFSDHFEQIPCKILMLCYDRVCKEFKPQQMEIVLAETLFPSSLSIDDKTRHWVFMFSLFTPCHLKALNAILSQKLRLRNEMQVYLTLLNKFKEEASEEVEKKIKMSIMKMSASFEDAAKAEDCFCKLDVVKDSQIFDLLEKLLTEQNIEDAQTTRDNLLRNSGDKNLHTEFLQLLSMKCSFNLFGLEHVRCIFDHLSGDRFGNKHLEVSSVQLLLTILSAFPSLLRGLETEFEHLLLEEVIPFNEQLIRILAKEGSHMSLDLGAIYPFLEKVCLEGSRAQSKLAISAIAALIGPEQSVFLDLCKTLVDSLHLGKHLPTVLQSLGCLAQHSVLAFQAHEDVVTHYIIEEIFQLTDVAMLEDLDLIEETSECSVSCQLKIFGLKALVRSFLPHQNATVSRPITFLLDIILDMLHKGSYDDGIISSDSDKAHLRLAAAKSVLQLSRRWDSIISPPIFSCTVLMAKDNSPLVQRLFIKKVQKLLKEHKIPCRYACAFPFAATDSSKDLQEIALKYMEEFVHEYGNAARINRISVMPGHVTGFPVYIVVFLIHILAHDPNFPSADHHDANYFAQFLSPLVFSLRALVDFNYSDGTVDLISKAISYLRSIFYAIKKAVDAVDAQITPNLHMLSDIGISLLDAINNTGVSHSHISGLILLPSSLYKVSEEHNSQGKSNLLIHYELDENFFHKLLDISKKKAQTAGTISTQYQKCQDGMTWSVSSGGGKSEMQFSKKGSLPLSMVKRNGGYSYSDKEEISEANQELTTRDRQKTSKPFSASASFELHKEFSIDDEHEDDAHGTIEAVIRTEQQPYCSRTLRSRPLSDQKDENPRSLKEKDTISRCKTIAREPSKAMKGNNSDICNSTGSKNNGEKLIRQHKETCTPENKCCSGSTEVFDSSNNSPKITCDSKEAEVFSLDSEVWGTSSNHSLLDQDSCGLQSLCSPGKNIEMIGSVSQQEDDLSDKAKIGRKRTALAELKNQESVHVDSSVSEVIDVNEYPVARRTRSRRV